MRLIDLMEKNVKTCGFKKETVSAFILYCLDNRRQIFGGTFSTIFTENIDSLVPSEALAAYALATSIDEFIVTYDDDEWDAEYMGDTKEKVLPAFKKFRDELVKYVNECYHPNGYVSWIHSLNHQKAYVVKSHDIGSHVMTDFKQRALNINSRFDIASIDPGVEVSGYVDPVTGTFLVLDVEPTKRIVYMKDPDKEFYTNVELARAEPFVLRGNYTYNPESGYEDSVDLCLMETEGYNYIDKEKVIRSWKDHELDLMENVDWSAVATEVQMHSHRGVRGLENMIGHFEYMLDRYLLNDYIDAHPLRSYIIDTALRKIIF